MLNKIAVTRCIVCAVLALGNIVAYATAITCNGTTYQCCKDTHYHGRGSHTKETYGPGVCITSNQCDSRNTSGGTGCTCSTSGC